MLNLEARSVPGGSKYFRTTYGDMTSHFTTNSARVVEGIWNRTRVAVKVLKTYEGVTPSIEVRSDPWGVT